MAERSFRRIVNLRGNPKSETFLSTGKSVPGASLFEFQITPPDTAYRRPGLFNHPDLLT